MNRTIKFRAWDVIKKEMRTHGDDRLHGSVTNIYLFERFSDCLMQFTGLLDKNGKEIYEGDVVTLPITVDHPTFEGCSYSNTDDKGVRTFKKVLTKGHCEVVYNDGEWLFKHKDKSKGFWIAKTDIDKWEVIGNIHQNPELL